MRISPRIIAVSALAVAACDPPEMVSERGDFRLAVEDLWMPDDPLDDTYWEAPYLVLEGTRMCPELKCSACIDADTCNKAALTASGPMQHEGGRCFTAVAPGEVVWSVGPQCGSPGLGPDEVHMRVVGLDQVEARAWNWLDAMVARHVAREFPTMEAVAAPWIDPLPRTLKVIAGQEVSLEVGLFDRTSGHSVASGRDQEAAVTWTTTRGRPPITYPSENLGVVAFDGTEAEATFTFAGRTWPLGQVIGVPPESATSLELAGALYIMEDPSAPLLGRSAVPLLARAVARDDAGDLLLGLPVTWSAEAGTMAYVPDFSQHEHLVLADNCLPPDDRAGAREFVLRANHGDLSATLDFTWTSSKQGLSLLASDGPDWTRPDTCLGSDEGCGCRSADPAGGSLLLLGLLALARRRRKSHALKNMSYGACLMAVPLVGCSEDPPAIGAAEVLPLGSLKTGFTPSQGGHSLKLGDRSLWVFRGSGDPWSSDSTAAVTADLDARDGLYPFTEYQTSYSDITLGSRLLQMDFEERNYGASHGDVDCASDCPRVVLRPGPLVHDPERARLLVFYHKLIEQSGEDERHVGSSIAVWRDDLGSDPVRPDVAEGGAEPTLLFGAEGPRLAAAALVQDEHIYAFACDGKDNPCVLLRAPLASPLARDAWQFYDRSSVWSDSHSRAMRLFDGAPMMSVHFSAYADAYLAVHAATDGASIVVRTAPRLEGPWSEAADIYRPAPSSFPPPLRDAALHPELARDGGAIDYLTHVEDESSGSLKLVEIHWD